MWGSKRRKGLGAEVKSILQKAIWFEIFFNIQKLSTHLLARLGWFCPVVSEPVKPYFTRILRVLTFCLGASKIVILKENGVVNGVVEYKTNVI